ncbi:NmrA family NAD(P)-binding protein [Demequina sp.]|uniref:NAD(P)H-binding protein n=1 Tax=Demequina sp. TaxID=2050685 RepID=UPI003A8AB100
MYLITGVDGKLCGLVVDMVLDQVPGDELILTSPFPERIPAPSRERWEAAGAQIRPANYDDVEQMTQAFRGADAGFMVSSMTVGEVRQQQHRNVIDAFKAAGVPRIVYSSGYGAGEANDEQVVIIDHHATEEYLKTSGLTWNVFRFNLYLENYLAAFAQVAMAEGKWRTCAGDHPCYPVAKADCAAAAAALLLGKAEPCTAWDITGSERVSIRDLCEIVSERSGVAIDYTPMTEEDLYAYYDSLFIPRKATGDFSRSPYPWCSEDIVTNEAAIRDGLLDNYSDDLTRLTGRGGLTARDILEDCAATWQ